MAVEIQPDQSRMDESMSGGAASSSGQGFLKRTAGQAGLPEDADVSIRRVPSRVPSGQDWRAQGL